MRGALALVSTLAVAGCASFSTLGRARVVSPGRLELFGAPAALLVTSGSGVSVRPVADVGARYGLTERLELDAKITTAGVTAGPRIQLLRSASRAHGFDVLLAPAIGFTSPDKLAFELPVLVGWNVRESDQIILAPRLVYLARVGAGGVSAPISFLFGGASLGYAWQVSRHVTLLPEVSLLTELFAQPGFSSNLEGGLGIQASAGVLFDL